MPVRVLIRSLLAAMVVAGAVTPAWAGAGADRLARFLDGLDAYQADFRQVLLDEDQRAVDESTGTLYLARPGRFRWDYQRPHAQVIVADGERLWLYDPDLEQVTVRPQQQSLGATPAALLSSTRPVEESFVLEDLDPGDQGDARLALKPRDPQATFEGIRLTFSGERLSTMELRDSFGQTTVLEFSNDSRNPVLDDSLFRFTPPPGVDVIQSQ